MFWKIVFSISMVLLIVLPIVAEAQKLEGIGVLATQTISRPRVLQGDEQRFAKGDMLYIGVVQSVEVGSMYISVHAQYMSKQDKWIDIPPAKNKLGAAYESEKYGGVRDFVYLNPVTNAASRSICLFMPYEAFNLDPGNYEFRYVIRLWDQNNKEIDQKRLTLPKDEVQVKQIGGKTTIISLNVKACAKQIAAGPLEPIPESEDLPSGNLRFFDLQNGKWVCP